MEKKDRAFLLFKNGEKQAEIANMLGISENTVSAWSSKGNWQQKIIADKISEATRTERTMKILNFQLQCIERQVDTQIEKENYTPLEGKYADGILKLYNTIKSEAVSYEVAIKVIRKFMEYAAAKDVETAKAMLPLSREFLAEMKEDL
jgi:uncharacterized protein YjcR